LVRFTNLRPAQEQNFLDDICTLREREDHLSESLRVRGGRELRGDGSYATTPRVAVWGEGQVTSFNTLCTKAWIVGEVPEDSHVRGHMEAELLHLDDPRVLELRRLKKPAADSITGLPILNEERKDYFHGGGGVHHCVGKNEA
jgi:hypothetical protein